MTLAVFNTAASGSVAAGFEQSFYSVSASSGAVTMTLPDATIQTNIGMEVEIIKNDSSANAVTVATTSSQSINGSTTDTLSTQYATGRYKSNGSGWYKF